MKTKTLTVWAAAILLVIAPIIHLTASQVEINVCDTTAGEYGYFLYSSKPTSSNWIERTYQVMWTTEWSSGTNTWVQEDITRKKYAPTEYTDILTPFMWDMLTITRLGQKMPNGAFAETKKTYSGWRDGLFRRGVLPHNPVNQVFPIIGSLGSWIERNGRGKPLHGYYSKYAEFDVAWTTNTTYKTYRWFCDDKTDVQIARMRYLQKHRNDSFGFIGSLEVHPGERQTLFNEYKIVAGGPNEWNQVHSLVWCAVHCAGETNCNVDTGDGQVINMPTNRPPPTPTFALHGNNVRLVVSGIPSRYEFVVNATENVASTNWIEVARVVTPILEPGQVPQPTVVDLEINPQLNSMFFRWKAEPYTGTLDEPEPRPDELE